MKESFKVSYAVDHDFYTIRTFPFGLRTEDIVLSKVGEAVLGKICRSKRPGFTNRVLWVKIAVILGG